MNLVIESLDETYKVCDERTDFLLIVMSALDQAGAPSHIQDDVAAILYKWSPGATAMALELWAANR